MIKRKDNFSRIFLEFKNIFLGGKFNAKINSGVVKCNDMFVGS